MLEVRHVTAKLLCPETCCLTVANTNFFDQFRVLRHFVSFRLNRTMFELFWATESRVADSVVC